MPRTKADVVELKPDTGTCTESELFDLFELYDVPLTDELQFPFTFKLTKMHTLHVERRATQRVTDKGLVDLFNWRVTENMVQPVRREN